MQSSTDNEFKQEISDSHLVGVSGWLLFFVIIFTLNALNLLALPFAVRLINWDVLWRANPGMTTYFALSSTFEFVAAVISAVIVVLILMRRKAAIAAVNLYCLLLGIQSLVGMFLVDSTVRLFDTGLPVINIAHYCKYISFFVNVDLERILAGSLYFAYVAVIAVALVFFLYFRTSRRVKATLINP